VAYERFGFEPVFPASSGMIHFTSQALIILILGLIMSIYPVYKIWRMNPITAMKK
jgi:ABC-type antimicrobial peptide transport system permease subunit